jgi:hypothetical protein
VPSPQVDRSRGLDARQTAASLAQRLEQPNGRRNTLKRNNLKPSFATIRGWENRALEGGLGEKEKIIVLRKLKFVKVFTVYL